MRNRFLFEGNDGPTTPALDDALGELADLRAAAKDFANEAGAVLGKELGPEWVDRHVSLFAALARLRRVLGKGQEYFTAEVKGQ